MWGLNDDGYFFYKCRVSLRTLEERSYSRASGYQQIKSQRLWSSSAMDMQWNAVSPWTVEISPLHDVYVIIILSRLYLMLVMNMIGLGTARRPVKAGYGVYGMDYEGHGKSDGLSAYVPNFDHLVDDVSAHYTSICGNLKV